MRVFNPLNFRQRQQHAPAPPDKKSSSPDIVRANTWSVQRAIEHFEQQAMQNAALANAYAARASENQYGHPRLSLPDSLHLITLDPLNLSPASARHRQPSVDGWELDSPAAFFPDNHPLTAAVEQAVADAEEKLEKELQEALKVAQTPDGGGARAQKHARFLASMWFPAALRRRDPLEPLNLSPGGRSTHSQFSRQQSMNGESIAPSMNGESVAPSIFSELRRLQSFQDDVHDDLIVAEDSWRAGQQSMTVAVSRHAPYHQEPSPESDDDEDEDESADPAETEKNIDHLKLVPSESTTSTGHTEHLSIGYALSSSPVMSPSMAAINAGATTCSGLYMMGWLRIFLIRRRLQKERKQMLARNKAAGLDLRAHQQFHRRHDKKNRLSLGKGRRRKNTNKHEPFEVEAL